MTLNLLNMSMIAMILVLLLCIMNQCLKLGIWLFQPKQLVLTVVMFFLQGDQKIRRVICVTCFSFSSWQHLYLSFLDRSLLAHWFRWFNHARTLPVDQFLGYRAHILHSSSSLTLSINNSGTWRGINKALSSFPQLNSTLPLQAFEACEDRGV